MGTCCFQWQCCLLLQGETPRARILGSPPFASVWLLTGWELSVSHLVEKRTEVSLTQEHSTSEHNFHHLVRYWAKGKHWLPRKRIILVARLKVFHEHCLSCWQLCYNHSQRTTLPLSVFICCQLPCSYLVRVLVGDSSFVPWFYSPQTQGILWLGSWMLWDT